MSPLPDIIGGHSPDIKFGVTFLSRHIVDGVGSFPPAPYDDANPQLLVGPKPAHLSFVDQEHAPLGRGVHLAFFSKAPTSAPDPSPKDRPISLT